MTTAARRTHVVIPSRIVAAIDTLVGRRGRSRFLVEAAEKELRRLAQAKAIRKAAGSWKDRDHPELRDGSYDWVRRIRSEGEGRLTKLTRKRR